MIDLENYVVSWNPSLGKCYNADAQKVAYEIAELGDGLEDSTLYEQIVEKGRNESTELHKCFEWNDTVAAEKYRIVQARDITRHLYYVRREPEDEEERQEDRTVVLSEKFRVFTHMNGTPGIMQTVHIVKDDDKYRQLLEQAMNELRAFKRKYECLKELKPILDLIQ